MTHRVLLDDDFPFIVLKKDCGNVRLNLCVKKRRSASMVSSLTTQWYGRWQTRHASDAKFQCGLNLDGVENSRKNCKKLRNEMRCEVVVELVKKSASLGHLRSHSSRCWSNSPLAREEQLLECGNVGYYFLIFFFDYFSIIFIYH